MWYFRSLHAHVVRELRAADLPANPEVLDAGCGTGGLLLRAGQQWPGARWQAIDFMPLACELARKRCGGAVEIREASITDLPYGDASFDAGSARCIAAHHNGKLSVNLDDSSNRKSGEGTAAGAAYGAGADVTPDATRK